jgi:beta-glucanase (GH16 family)
MLTKLASVALAATLVSAQTFSTCNPTLKDGCPNPKALGSKTVETDFRTGTGSFLKELDGTKITHDKDLGAVYSINKETDAPTTQSDLWIFFGQVDVELRAAPGVGIVTSVVLQSADLDEIDWEWVGKDNTQVQTNYFSKGCTEVYDRGGFSPVSNPIGDYHTYTIKWTRDRLDWIIDGTTVRTLMAKDAKGCSGYPQSPMQVKLGTWVAGKSSAAPGTIEWAGGLANFDSAPFNAYYKSIRVQDFMGGGDAKEATEYVYTDRTGSWQSIKVVNDGKAVDNGSKDSSSSSSGSATKTSDSSSTSTGFSTVTSTTPTTTGSGSSTGTTGGSSSGTGAGSQTSHTAAPNAAGKLALGNVAVVGAALAYLAL